METFDIFTDGACRRGGRGAWGVVIQSKDGLQEFSGKASKRTTSQRMELTAAINGLLQVPSGSKVEVVSDSAYLINCFQKCWHHAWEDNGWRSSSNRRVANRDLWEELILLSRLHEITWTKVKGHSGNVLNELADELANLELDQQEMQWEPSIL